MPTKQPVWRFLANLGDVNPFISAALVFIDITGVYDPELVIFDENRMDRDAGKWYVSRIVLGRCSMMSANPSSISDNRFHADKPAWFASKLEGVASSVGRTAESLANELISNDPLKRAEAYMALAGYFGLDEFDTSPHLMTRGEIKKRYRAAFPRSRKVKVKGSLALIG